ncbi:MAG: hypothetical protein KIT34_09445 [Cyanobacteria bacterium TGS_CYA1]|nr:hypothetical protein [Cyanobacteria bacterium TGS_CYA1]
MNRFFRYCLPALCVLILSAQASFAADQASTINSLENHFFEHTYPQDNDEKRVERLEKLVFGESKTGDIQSRLQSLSSSMPKDTDASQLASNPNNQSNQNNQVAQNNNQAPPAQDQSATNQNSTPDDPSTDYPRVDAAEHLLLGKTFPKEPISRRLDQLEAKAFGKPSGNPDLSDRVDKLDDYIQSRYHQSIAELTDPRKQLHYSSNSDDVNLRPVSLNRNPQYPSEPSNAPSVNAPLQDQVSWMEQKIFGQSMQNSPMSLLDRVKRLEGQVFPGEATDTTASLPMQVKVLMNAVELSVVAPPRQTAQAPQFNHQVAYNQQSYAQPQYQQQPQQQYQQPQQQYQQPQQQYQQQQAQQEEPTQSKGHPFLKSLAKTLMTVGSMAASSMSYGGMGGMNSMGYGGMGYNPMGYGGMPLNMGGGPSGFMW